MANDLSNYVDQFTTQLDGVLEAGPLTNDLNMNRDFIGRFTGAGQVEIPTIALQGLGKYERNVGFVDGDITLSWTSYTLKHDRGRQFSIDDVDDEERARIVSANVMGEFARLEVVPEVDAIRFATLAASASSEGTAAAGEISTADAAKKAILDAEEYQDDIGGGTHTSCILYCTGSFKRLLREGVPWQFGKGDQPDTDFETFDGMKIVTVPKNRFYTDVELFDGKTDGEADGGYAKSASGAAINFMLVNPSCCAAITKHQKLRYFSPDTNQTADSHLWQYRLYHDLLVYKNKAELIYLSATA